MPLGQAQLATDVATMISGGDFGVSVTYGATTITAILDRYDDGNPEPDTDKSKGGKWYSVQIPTGALGALTPETAITVNGLAMRLITWDKDKPDAGVTILYCQTP